MDGKFGLFCSDGAFVQRPWPTEDQCQKVSICRNLPDPDSTKFYKVQTKEFVAKGEFVHYECSDSSAILDDNSGKNFFSLMCDGDDVLGIYEFPVNLPTTTELPVTTVLPTTTPVTTVPPTAIPDATEGATTTFAPTTAARVARAANDSTTILPIPVGSFTPINGSFAFPKCRRLCNNFYIGRADFKPVNDTIETRAGDVAEFKCKEGYFIDGTVSKLYVEKYINTKCTLSLGPFQSHFTIQVQG